MANNNNEVMSASQHDSCPKVHNLMCSELRMMLDRVSSILPSIEDARPGSSTGIQELCKLYNTVEKGKLIIQQCIESSSLYLAFTREATVLRCERIRDTLRQSLSQIQNMVPPILANQIAELHSDLGNVKFVVDPTEEEAGKVMLEMLRQPDATEEFECETFLQVASKLNLTSPKAMLIERRAIHKLLKKTSGTDPKKEDILKFFVYLIKRYGKNTKTETCEQHENAHPENGSSTPKVSFASDTNTPGKFYTNMNPERYYDQSNLSGAIPPAEFCCPMSTKLMCDPVIISSGQTYERKYIERWFSEGCNTCPRTQVKLENYSMIPNSGIRTLISNWCNEHGFTISEFVPPAKNDYSYLPEQLHNLSISSLQNVSVPLIAGKAREYVFDHSNTSIALSDASYVSESSHLRGMEEPKDNFARFSWNADYQKYLSFCNFNQDMFQRFFYELSELPMELQGEAVKDLKSVLDDENEVWRTMVSNGFVEAFLEFLKNDNGSCSVHAQKTGLQFFLAFLSDSRTQIPSMSEDALHLITSFLDSELKIEALLILYELIQHPSCWKSHLMASVVTPSVFEILGTEDVESLELSLKIICELSCDTDIKSYLISSGIISNLSSILSEGSFTECCLRILRNLVDVEEAQVLITRADNCLGSIVEYLDTGVHKEREHAVVILLTICSRSMEDCLLVMKEGVIPALVDLSVNGIDEGKHCSIKLLHLLRDMRLSDQFSNSCSQEVAVPDIVVDPPNSPIRKEPRSKSSRLFSRKLNIFSKPRSLTLF